MLSQYTPQSWSVGQVAITGCLENSAFFPNVSCDDPAGASAMLPDKVTRTQVGSSALFWAQASLNMASEIENEQAGSAATSEAVDLLLDYGDDRMGDGSIEWQTWVHKTTREKVWKDHSPRGARALDGVLARMSVDCGACCSRPCGAADDALLEKMDELTLRIVRCDDRECTSKCEISI